MDIQIMIWLVLVTFTDKLSLGQRTYMRSCDCEPAPDGRCAYTLMLPLATNSAGKESCPIKAPQNNLTTQSNRDDLVRQISKIEKDMDMMNSNISDIRTWSGDQAKIISQLQSKVMELSDILLRDTDSNQKSMKNNNNNNCMNCSDLQTKIDNQTSQINQIIKHLGNIQNQSKNVENVTATLQSKLGNIQNMSAQLNTLEQQLASVGIELNNAYSELNSLKSDYYLCNTKGMLVSGDNKYVDNSGINSSSNSLGGTAVRGRINSTSINNKPGAWCADEPNNNYEWLQFDLGSPKVIYGVVTRGRSDYSQWVTSYKIQTTDVWEGDDGWTTYKDVVGFEMLFPGNTDMNSPVTHTLWQPVKARYIRFVPETGFEGRNKCMRADVIGCLDSDP